MQLVLCGDDKDEMYRVMCIRTNMANYSAEPTPAARQTWLIGHGCPPPMVQPEKYAAAVPASAK
ncbi:MAG TPA: hypothetical protein VH374_14765 [Polyangia bacterium]|nr:hypothetical protein [Polyangia bacterium]